MPGNAITCFLSRALLVIHFLFFLFFSLDDENVADGGRAKANVLMGA